MHAEVIALLKSAELKITSGVPTSLTERERENYAAIHGAQRLASALTLKADPTPLTTKAAAPHVAASPAVSRAWVRRAFEAYAEGAARAVKQALQVRDARIVLLEQRLLELEADRAARQELVP